MKQAIDYTSAERKAKNTLVINGIEITVYKMWAVNLMKREAAGESLEAISKESWREVLGFDKTVSAGVVADKLRSAVA